MSTSLQYIRFTNSAIERLKDEYQMRQHRNEDVLRKYAEKNFPDQKVHSVGCKWIAIEIKG